MHESAKSEAGRRGMLSGMLEPYESAIIEVGKLMSIKGIELEPYFMNQYSLYTEN